ncbi:MAG: CDP-alcohol phosphatidyltransferase family protein [Promethearchaeota archaeon]|jgi:phosphatidylglycerophosphate synthase
MTEILFTLVFPLVLLLILIIIFISGIFKEKPSREFMSCNEFIKDWLKDHGQAHKVDEQFAKMKKDPAGKLYMPITYRGAKIFIKLGISPNKVSVIGLILSFFIFWGVIMASGLLAGHTLNPMTQQPFYGSWFFALAFLVLYTGISDGIDGAIARLLDIKSKTGAWLDNIIDRVSDILVLVCFVPTSLLFFPSYGLDFTWMVWTNIFLIFIYEYMRARHEGLGLHETKPFVGERITRVIVNATFFFVYGISSFVVFLTYLVNPSTTIWNDAHLGVITWTMLIYQIVLLAMMVFSIILFAKYIWKNLKIIEKK